MKKVYICSPYASTGDIETNTRNARSYARLAISQLCVPIAPHLYFPQFMEESNDLERRIGLNIGLELIKECDELWQFGEATGAMQYEIALAASLDKPIVAFGVRGENVWRKA